MKKVLFSQRVEIVESYGERRDCADQRIAEFIYECGFLPIPVTNVPHIVKAMVNEIKPIGIVLTGGNSLVKYGGNAPERDDTDRILLELAIKNKIPLYGFCRGMQSILDYFGNNLSEVIGHVGVRHTVFGAEQIREVNSYHNQACVHLNSDELSVLLNTEDGVIEKIKHQTLPIIGTMWHPEREKPFNEDDLCMVKELFLSNMEEENE